MLPFICLELVVDWLVGSGISSSRSSQIDSRTKELKLPSTISLKKKMKSFSTKNYLEQTKEWPNSGRHIMAHYDDRGIVVYQAYRSEIGDYAAKNNKFGGAFSFSRMSWIKPNFLWMMHRSGWGTKEGQEVVLAITIPCSLFDEILTLAVPSSFSTDLYSSQEEWKRDVSQSDVRLQWDPDHDPSGQALERRAIQLGLRGGVLARYAREEVVSIEDISEFVEEQKVALEKDEAELIIPSERIYIPNNPAAIKRVVLESPFESNSVLP